MNRDQATSMGERSSEAIKAEAIGKVVEILLCHGVDFLTDFSDELQQWHRDRNNSPLNLRLVAQAMEGGIEHKPKRRKQKRASNGRQD